MRKSFWQMPKTLIITSIIMMLTINPQWIYGEQTPNEAEILQHFLTIHEIEKEIERVGIQEADLQRDISALANKIVKHQEQMQVQKERAGTIARAYYMGDRSDLLILLFSTKDLQQFLQAYDYVSYLFEKDNIELQAFHEQVVEFKSLLAKKEDQITDLSNLQKHLLAQKALMLRIDTELSSLMAGLTDQEKLILLQQELITNWEKQGLPAFDLLLHTLSQSMSGVAAEVKDQVTFSLTGAKIMITDNEFSSFIQKQNKLFHDFTISFADNKLTFFGTYEDIVLTLSGSYQLESEELVRFHIDEMRYNGFILPQTTAKALENIYDLGIYPRQINDRLRIKDVKIEDGALTIHFTLQL